MFEPDRRRAERVVLKSPIPGQVGRQSVAILEIGLVGSRIEHHQPLVVDSQITLAFEWDEEKLELPARVARCELQSLRSESAGEMIYQSGLEFLRDAGRSSNMLRRMIGAYVTRALEEIKKNARGGKDAGPVPFLHLETPQGPVADFDNTRVYIHCRLSAGHWEKTESLNPRQPPDGFTVLATQPPDEVDLLCKMYSDASEEGRKMLRVCAELSLRE